MKKTLLVSAVFIALVNTAGAQTIFTEDFESCGNSIPAGWHQQLPAYIPDNQGWKVNTTIGGTLAPYVAPHTHYAFVNDLDHNSAQLFNRDTMYTPVLNFTGHSSVFISFDYWYYGGFLYNPGDYEIASVAASGDGGITWTTIDTMGCWETSAWRTGLYDLSAYAGNPNVMIAFTYDDLSNDANGFVVDNVNIYQPINYDVGVTGTNMFYLCKTNNTYSITGTIHNYGGSAINSMHLKYTVNNGPVQSDFISSLSIAPLNDYYFTHTVSWTPAASGDYTLKIWADTLNGSNPDQLHTNDTLSAYFVVMDTLQAKSTVIEEFSQASCDPCMRSSPNLDSVLYNNMFTCNPLRYHVSYPGQDFMNQVTQTADVGPRVSYYSIMGVPDALIDGVYDVYPGYVSSADLQSARAHGSPFSIVVYSIYNSSTNQYNATAYITAHVDMPAGLTARAVLTVDTLMFQDDQSQEDPPSSFAPPIGTGAVPDFYYPYTLNYPQVVEDIMPSANGFTLGAFTNGQTQAVNFSWTKNHPWSNNAATWPYDSTAAHITVFVQNDGDLHAGWGALPKYIYQSANDGMVTGIAQDNQLSAQVSVYPNPFSAQTTITVSTTDHAPCMLEVYDLAGKKIISTAFGNDNKVVLDAQQLSDGIYFYRVVQENAVVASGKMVRE